MDSLAVYPNHAFRPSSALANVNVALTLRLSNAMQLPTWYADVTAVVHCAGVHMLHVRHMFVTCHMLHASGPLPNLAQSES